MIEIGGGVIHCSGWMPIGASESFIHANMPGIYMLGKFLELPTHHDVDEGILYIGKTIKRSLKTRFGEFYGCAFQNKTGHSGGNEFRRLLVPPQLFDRYMQYPPPNWLYVYFISVSRKLSCFDTEISSLESDLIERFIHKYGKLPLCNRKK